jgi:hypothetical protein
MNANVYCLEEEELDYGFSASRQIARVGNHATPTESRNLTGRERVAQQSRYQRRSAPSRTSGMHCRGNQRRGI